jgi:5-methylcytosine-specific restriction endonuclease McrA
MLASALKNGTLHWSSVRELTRVAVPETEREWLEVAHDKSVRQLEELVAGKCPGDTPSSPSQPSERRRVLRFEVAPETFALFREAMIALRRSTDAALDDDSALLALARIALGGPRDDGRASYQISISVCPECGRGHQLAGGELMPIDADIVAMAHCDGQHLGRITPLAANQNAGAPLEVAVMNESEQLNENGPARAKGPPLQGGANDNDAHVSADLSANDSPGAHMGARASAPNGTSMQSSTASIHSHRQPARAHAGARAKQTTPPALRRAVLLRDRRCCSVPGCRNAAFLDVHHLELRSEGGSHQADNLTTLCGAHHRAAHRGKLLIDCNQPHSLRFRHADGSEYGRAMQPQALEIQAKVFSALRNLGFREGEVRAVLSGLRNPSTQPVTSFDPLLREALAKLRPSSPR